MRGGAACCAQDRACWPTLWSTYISVGVSLSGRAHSRTCTHDVDWRVPFKPVDSTLSKTSVEELEDYATYVRLMSWFLDDPSPLCPFSVHRMALIGKELGKEVGEWFGPSTAAGALKQVCFLTRIIGRESSD